MAVTPLLWLLTPLLTFSHPAQIRLSISDSPGTTTFTWTTFWPTASTEVEVCESGQCRSVSGVESLFLFDDEEEIGEAPIPRYIHTVEVGLLEAGKVYSYQVGSEREGVWSSPRFFRTHSDSAASSARFIAFGDLGTCSDLSLPTVDALIEEAKSLQYDFFIQIGDFAYNLNTDNGRRGDDFLEDSEGFASRAAFMTVVGNHERYQNYTHYRNLFRMPGDSEGFYYSFDVGPVHAVVYSTETLCRMPHCPALHKAQLEWLQSDITAARSAKRPWIITFSHEPLYCSVDWLDLSEYQNCVLDASARRALYEDLFQSLGVDVHFHGHMHNYERLGPVFKKSAAGSEVEATHLVVNPSAAVYIVTGAAGSCLEGDIAPSSTTPEDFSLFRTEEFSYSRILAEKEVFKVEQVSAVTGEVLDYLFVVKTK